MKPEEQKLLDKLLADERLTPNYKWVAYIMATVKHETADTFLPVKEAYWLSESWRMNNLRYAPYYGRGYVQLTWKYNYEKASAKLRIPDLVSNPDRVMEPDIAYEIMVEGMIHGWFTGKDLDDYINNSYTDYYRARRIINGMDRARLVERYAKEYEALIDDRLAMSIVPPSDDIFTYEDENPFLDQIDNLWDEGVNVEQNNQRLYGCHNKVLSIDVRHSPLLKNCVRFLQAKLNDWRKKENLVPITVDGDFGPKTQRAVQLFQGVEHLMVDGIVGQNSWSKLL